MQSHLVSWIVALGMAAAVTGCSSMESSGGTRMVDASVVCAEARRHRSSDIVHHPIGSVAPCLSSAAAPGA